MANTNLGNQLSTILSVETNRAYSNLFEVSFSNIQAITSSTVTSERDIMPYLAQKISFEDSFGIEMDYNEAIQAFMMKGATRIKGVSISFKETSHYNVLDFLNTWSNAIYDFENHYFNEGNPTGSIEVKLNDNVNTFYFNISDAIPKSLTYPTYSWSDSKQVEIEASFYVGNVIFSSSAAF